MGGVIHNPMGDWWPRAIERFARFLCGRPRVIMGHVEPKTPYLSRYYILGMPHHPDGQWPFDENGDPREGIIHHWSPVGIYLHCFHRSDNAGGLHSHPWRYMLSWILSGGYIEERWEPMPDLFKGLGLAEKIRQRLVRPGFINILTGQTFHRVDLFREVPEGPGPTRETPCWTLFLVCSKFASWGFRDRKTGRFIPWKKYIQGSRGANGISRPPTRAEVNDLDEMGVRLHTSPLPEDE